MDEIYNKIESIAAESNGFVKTSQIEAAGINRDILRGIVTSAHKTFNRVRYGQRVIQRAERIAAYVKPVIPKQFPDAVRETASEHHHLV